MLTTQNEYANLALPRQKPRIYRGSWKRIRLWRDIRKSQDYPFPSQKSIRRGFVMAYPLIMLERLWSRLSKIMTAVDISRIGSSCQVLMLKGAIAIHTPSRLPVWNVVRCGGIAYPLLVARTHLSALPAGKPEYRP